MKNLKYTFYVLSMALIIVLIPNYAYAAELSGSNTAWILTSTALNLYGFSTLGCSLIWLNFR